MSAEPCANPVHHHPQWAYTDLHHKVPESWGGPTQEDNLVALCQTCHHAVHWLIDEAIKHGAVPTSRHLSPYVRGLAQYAWDRRPPHPTPTLAHPWQHIP